MTGAQFDRARALLARKPMTARRRRRALAHLVAEAGARPIRAAGRVVGFGLPGGYVACVKKRYRDQAQAEADREGIQRFAERVGQAHQFPVRAYHCPNCRGWHVTSHE